MTFGSTPLDMFYFSQAMTTLYTKQTFKGGPEGLTDMTFYEINSLADVWNVSSRLTAGHKYGSIFLNETISWTLLKHFLTRCKEKQTPCLPFTHQTINLCKNLSICIIFHLFTNRNLPITLDTLGLGPRTFPLPILSTALFGAKVKIADLTPALILHIG